MDVRNATARAGTVRASQTEGVVDAVTDFFMVLGAGTALFLLFQQFGLI